MRFRQTLQLYYHQRILIYVATMQPLNRHDSLAREVQKNWSNFNPAFFRVQIRENWLSCITAGLYRPNIYIVTAALLNSSISLPLFPSTMLKRSDFSITRGAYKSITLQWITSLGPFSPSPRQRPSRSSSREQVITIATQELVMPPYCEI